MDKEERDKNLKNIIKSNLITSGIDSKMIEQLSEQIMLDVVNLLSKESNLSHE